MIRVEYSAVCDKCAGLLPDRFPTKKGLTEFLRSNGWTVGRKTVCNGNYHGGA